MKLLTIIGTRPEAVKMAPVLLALGQRAHVRSRICLTGQHRDLARPILDFFGLSADLDLGLMVDGQSPGAFVGRAMLALDALIAAEVPDCVLVQGDTASTFAGAQAAFLAQVPVVHIEAGLRTYDAGNPWPEEHFRCHVDRIADTLLAPTPAAAANLHREGIAGAVHVTGNSGIDALNLVLGRLDRDDALRRRADAALPQTASDRPLLLATVHRRETLEHGVEGIFAALASIASRGVADIVLPLHPNPIVARAAARSLHGVRGIHLVPPLGPGAMVRLMQRVDLILTDSGGIQEEAPTLGKHVLILRQTTERPEAAAAGLATLVGTDPQAIVPATEAALAADNATAHRGNPFGDGKAAARIAARLLGEAADDFVPQLRAGPVPIRLVG